MAAIAMMTLAAKRPAKANIFKMAAEGSVT